MSSDDSDANFEAFVKQQKKIVNKRYISESDIEENDIVQDFIADDRSIISYETSNSSITSEQSDKLCNIFSDDEFNRKDISNAATLKHIRFKKSILDENRRKRTQSKQKSNNSESDTDSDEKFKCLSKHKKMLDETDDEDSIKSECSIKRIATSQNVLDSSNSDNNELKYHKSSKIKQKSDCLNSDFNEDIKGEDKSNKDLDIANDDNLNISDTPESPFATNKIDNLKKASIYLKKLEPNEIERLTSPNSKYMTLIDNFKLKKSPSNISLFSDLSSNMSMSSKENEIDLSLKSMSLSDLNDNFTSIKSYINSSEYKTRKCKLNLTKSLKTPLKFLQSNLSYDELQKLNNRFSKTEPLTKLKSSGVYSESSDEYEEDSFIVYDDDSKENNESISTNSSYEEEYLTDTDSISYNESQENKLNYMTPRLKKQSNASIRKLIQTAPLKNSKKKIQLDFISSLMNDINKNLEERDFNADFYRRKFNSKKQELTKTIFDIYNVQVFNEIMPKDTVIEWSKTLKKTGGRCINTFLKTHSMSNEFEYSIMKIELASKVITDTERLVCTLVHEMCHGVAWLLHHVSGHGSQWQQCCLLAHSAFPRVPLSSRCHTYQINYKYEYWCTKCNKIAVKRHSKSLDLSKYFCLVCNGKLQIFQWGKHQLFDKKNTNQIIFESPVPQKLNKFAEFVKHNYKLYRTPGSTHREAMLNLSGAFKSSQTSSSKTQINDQSNDMLSAQLINLNLN